MKNVVLCLALVLMTYINALGQTAYVACNISWDVVEGKLIQDGLEYKLINSEKTINLEFQYHEDRPIEPYDETFIVAGSYSDTRSKFYVHQIIVEPSDALTEAYLEP